MAQTGFTPIQLYSTSTAAAAPVAGNLTNSTLGSELAINITDGKLFYKDNANVVQVIGWKVVPATAGGTGQTSYAVGDILFANTTTSLAKLADVATGNALISGGVGVAPAYGKIGLTTHVSDTLPVANGGTGTATAFTAGSVVFAGASGVYSQDNANFFWNDSTNTLGVGTNTPAGRIHAVGGQVFCDMGSGAGNTVSYNLELGRTTSVRASIGTLKDAATDNVKALTLGVNQNPYQYVHVSGGVSIGTSTDPGADNLSLTGNLVIATSGKGIDFSGVGTAAEILDDYEEGTFTPTAGFVILTSATGKYTKIGRAVHFVMEVTLPVTISTAGARFGGLPFTASADNYACAVWTNKGAAVYCDVSASGTQAGLYYVTTGGIYDYVDFSGDSVRIAGTYFI